MGFDLVIIVIVCVPLLLIGFMLKDARSEPVQVVYDWAADGHDYDDRPMSTPLIEHPSRSHLGR